MAETGMSKQDAQTCLRQNCRVSVQTVLINGDMPLDADNKWLHQPELQHLANDLDTTVPALESPEQYLLFVTGRSTPTTPISSTGRKESQQWLWKTFKGGWLPRRSSVRHPFCPRERGLSLLRP